MAVGSIFQEPLLSSCHNIVGAGKPINVHTVVHTGPKANTKKTQNKQIYVVPQNRVRPRRQQIVYYWRNDTNTQLNPVQSHKTQCFTLTLGVSLKSTLAHSHSCTIFFFCTLALSCTLSTFSTLHSLPSLSLQVNGEALTATHVQNQLLQ